MVAFCTAVQKASEVYRSSLKKSLLNSKDFLLFVLSICRRCRLDMPHFVRLDITSHTVGFDMI